LGILKEARVDGVELSGTGLAKMKDEKAPYFIKIAASMRKEIGLPIIVVGGVRDMDEIERALDKGIDCVAMSRAFICEPDLVSRLRRGKKAKCIQCNKCFTLPKTKGKRCVFH
jgi:2,4-dienoyl-CoA reductase-like NADH-dependent reductase (Old Yellow Enzyme family)